MVGLGAAPGSLPTELDPDSGDPGGTAPLGGDDAGRVAELEPVEPEDPVDALEPVDAAEPVGAVEPVGAGDARRVGVGDDGALRPSGSGSRYLVPMLISRWATPTAMNRLRGVEASSKPRMNGAAIRKIVSLY